MKKLPEIYKAKVTKTTNQKYNYTKNTTEVAKSGTNQVILENKEPIETTLKKIFQNKVSSYTKKVKIKTSEKTFFTRLVYQTEKEVLTIDNEKIPLEKIISIQML